MAHGDWKKTKGQMDDLDQQVKALQAEEDEFNSYYNTLNNPGSTRDQLYNAVAYLGQHRSWHSGRLPEIQAQRASIAQNKQALQGQYDLQYGLDNQRGQMLSQYESGARQNLAKSLADNRTGANNRGLLYSGIKQGSDADAYGSVASQMANYTGQVNNSQDDQLDQYKGQQAIRGLDRYQLASDAASSDYRTALQRRQTALQQQAQNQGSWASIGGAIGSVGGLLI